MTCLRVEVWSGLPAFLMAGNGLIGANALANRAVARQMGTVPCRSWRWRSAAIPSCAAKT